MVQAHLEAQIQKKTCRSITYRFFLFPIISKFTKSVMRSIFPLKTAYKINKVRVSITKGLLWLQLIAFFLPFGLHLFISKDPLRFGLDFWPFIIAWLAGFVAFFAGVGARIMRWMSLFCLSSSCPIRKNMKNSWALSKTTFKGSEKRCRYDLFSQHANGELAFPLFSIDPRPV